MNARGVQLISVSDWRDAIVIRAFIHFIRAFTFALSCKQVKCQSSAAQGSRKTQQPVTPTKRRWKSGYTNVFKGSLFSVCLPLTERKRLKNASPHFSFVISIHWDGFIFISWGFDNSISELSTATSVKYWWMRFCLCSSQQRKTTSSVPSTLGDTHNRHNSNRAISLWYRQNIWRSIRSGSRSSWYHDTLRIFPLKPVQLISPLLSL